MGTITTISPQTKFPTICCEFYEGSGKTYFLGWNVSLDTKQFHPSTNYNSLDLWCQGFGESLRIRFITNRSISEWMLLNLAASTVILQWEAIRATLRLAMEIWRINQSCEVLTKARGNVQPLWVKPKVKTNEMLCESNAKVRGNVQPLWA